MENRKPPIDSIFPVDDYTLMVRWETGINPEVNVFIHHLAERLASMGEIEETVPAYDSLLVVYHARVTNIDENNTQIAETYETIQSKVMQINLVTIPVCYHENCGKDLLTMAKHKEMSVSDLISLHTKPIYTVQMIGFLPGFPYLGGLLPALDHPRKTVPEKHVSAGSIGIGGNQTGIYPVDSPGGWHIIGRTPLAILNLQDEKPCLLNPGDRVKFKAIDLHTFETWQNSPSEIQSHGY